MSPTISTSGGFQPRRVPPQDSTEIAMSIVASNGSLDDEAIRRILDVMSGEPPAGTILLAPAPFTEREMLARTMLADFLAGGDRGSVARAYRLLGGEIRAQIRSSESTNHSSGDES